MIHLMDRIRDRASNRGFEHRIAEWDRGEIELTDDEGTRYLASCDPDIVLITAYLGGELDSAEAAGVGERARTDSAFGEKLRLIVHSYSRAGRFDLDSAPPEWDEDVVDETFAAAESRRGLRWVAGCVLVAVLMVVAIAHGKFTAYRTRLAERIGDRATTLDFKEPITVAAGARDTSLAFQLMDVALRPGSRLTYGSMARRAGGSGVLALDGEAAFHAWAAGPFVRTVISDVHVLAGRYAIRSIPHSGVMLVTVDSGLAWIEPPGMDSLGASQHRRLAVVRPGEHAFVTRGGAVTVIKGGVGFPASAFTAPIGTFANDSSPDQVGLRRAYAATEPAIIMTHGIRR